MRTKLNKHPCLLAFISVIFIIGAFIGSNVVAGIQDRFSHVDLVPAPDNYIRLPNVEKPSNFLRPYPRTLRDPITLLSGNTSIGQTGRGLFNEPKADEVWLGNDEGNLMLKGEIQLAIAGKTVLIDDIDDLTYLSGDPSGNSIFWMDWGNHYIVDFYSIQFSGGTDNPLSGTTTVRLSGITGIFRSVLKKDDQKTITVEIGQTEAEAWELNQSGASVLQIWAPLSSGLTIYADDRPGSAVTAILTGDSGTTTQVLQITDSTGDVVVNEETTVLRGGYDSEVKKLGDQKTWKANYLSGISVTPVRKSIVADLPADTGKIVFIDSADDLSTWSGAVGGSSYFQMEAGKTYIVDTMAINASLVMSAFTGVTAHLPKADTASNLTEVKVILATTTGVNTTYVTGVTTVEIWPWPDSGSTQFRTTATYMSQNMLGAASGTSEYTAVYTGYHGLDGIGEGVTYGIMNSSAVSAYVAEKNVYQN